MVDGTQSGNEGASGGKAIKHENQADDFWPGEAGIGNLLIQKAKN